MNHIVKSLLNNFIESHEIKSDDEDKNFEHFCNYAIVKSQYNKTFGYNEISTGGGDDTGIDGIGIIVNGHLVDSEDEIDDLYEGNKYLDVDFIFIQSKNSPSFNSGDILKFYRGVLDFFNEPPSLKRNSEITKFSELANKIFDDAVRLKNHPSIKVFYITIGTNPDDDDNINGIIDDHKKDLNSLNLFDQIKVELLGAKEIGNLYKRTQNPISSKFKFVNNVALLPIKGVKEAYYGTLPFEEFKKILIDDNDKLLNIFDDNVRDYQGKKNPVNKKIFETLESKNPYLFSVLNNGVTVVADSITNIGVEMVITDYQIVNGCQTSNVLFENINQEGIDEIHIPLRLIATKDNDVKAQITASTNRQTSIKTEQLSAMSDFQKGLEEYYNSRLDEEKIYYERRSKQYDSDKNVKKNRIITIKDQVKSYSSMFRKDPHAATRYFGTLAKNIGKKDSGLCEAKHHYAPYYMAGLAYYKLDSLFGTTIDRKFKDVRYQILMLALMIMTDLTLPLSFMNSERKTEAFCEPIIKKLLNKTTCLKVFQRAVEIIERSGVDITDRQFLKSGSITFQISEEFKDTDRI